MKIKSTKTLTRKLDEIFSKYIRKRDTNKQGYIKCYCGKIITYEEADASHFVSRQHLSTRYDEQNVHASCRHCNRFLEGNKEDYSLFLIQKYGCEIIEKLNKKKYEVCYNFPFEEKIEYYKNKVKELDK